MSSIVYENISLITDKIGSIDVLYLDLRNFCNVAIHDIKLQKFMPFYTSWNRLRLHSQCTRTKVETHQVVVITTSNINTCKTSLSSCNSIKPFDLSTLYPLPSTQLVLTPS